jgi:replicative DNA helicase
MKKEIVDPMLELDVVSYLLEQPYYITEAVKIVDDGAFTIPLNKAIYSACVELSQTQGTFSRYDVFRLLKTKESKLGINSSEMLKFLPNRTIDLTEVCVELKEMHTKRKMFEIANDISRRILNGDDAETIQANLHIKVDELIEGSRTTKEVTHLQEIYDDVIKDLSANAGQVKFSGIDTGSRLLNYIFGGWQNGRMIIIAGRPSMGKTIVGLEHAKCGAKSGKNVLFLSLETSKEDLTHRFISSEASEYTYADLGSYRVGKDDIEKIKDSDAKMLRQLPIYFYDGDNRDVNYLSNIAVAETRKNKIDMIVIDYLQLIRDNQIKDQSDFAQVSSVSNKIQKLTRKLNIPIIVLSQLSRTIEGRADKRPSLSDLRSSGNIEQDASIVIGLFRPDYYAVSEARANNLPEPEMTHILDYVILKNRNGRTGSAERYCDIMTNRVNDDKEMLFRFTQPDIIYKDTKINEIPNNFENDKVIPF